MWSTTLFKNALAPLFDGLIIIESCAFAMPLLQSMLDKACRHARLLWNDWDFVGKTMLLVAWLAVGLGRDVITLPFKFELVLHIAVEVVFSRFEWRDLLGVFGFFLHVLMPVVWFAVIGAGYDMIKFLPGVVHRWIMRALWSCMFPKVVLAYLATFFKKLRDNHGRLYQ